MKKFLTGIMIAVMAMSLCACGGSDNSNDNASNEKTVDNDGESNKDTNESSAKEGDLKLLCTLDSKGARCDTDTGYYYITEEYEELEDGNWGGHIMYMDYATQQEVYLCNDAGCNHMNKDCNSVILEGDYMVFSTLLFTQNNKLYFLSKEQDQEGSLDTNLMIGGETESNEVVSQPCVLYEANLDGTDRHKVYTFDQGLTLEDYVIGDGKGIYVVTKNI